MPQLIVEVRDKIARGNKERIVCGNSDYTIKFEFDEMWDAYPTKTALYKWGEEFKESERVPFEGDVCRVPKMLNTSGFKVGVYAGDLCSTTPAYFGADQSILCNTTEQDPPAPDIYNEIMELINKKAGGDPILIRKVFTDVVESGELIYNWAVIPSKYIFRDVVIGGTPDEPGEDVIVTPEQMPVYGEDLIIEIEGTPYQAKWLSENAIDNGGGDAWVSLNDDGTVTVGGMIGNWVVSLYKASDISPVIIPRDHIPEEQDPTVEDWAKKQEVKYVFRDIHLPSGVYSTVITPEVMPTYGDELIICAEGLFDAKRATWLSETTIDNGGGDLTAYIHEDGTMTISSMMDGVTAYLYYPVEKSVVPADRLPVVDWAIDEDPFVFKDIIIPSGDNQEVTITPNRIPKNGDILMMKVGYNHRDAKWESASRIVVGEEAWVQINDDGTITIGSMSGNTSLSLYYGSIGQSKANLIFSEQDPTVEEWAKTNITYYFRAYIPTDENWNIYEVRIPYITHPSLGDSAIVRISAGSWYNTYDATFTENGWEFSNPYFTADYWISDNEDGTVTIGSMSGDIYMEMYKSVPKDASVPASKLPIYEWTIKEDPYIVKDLTVYYGNPVTVKPKRMPIYSNSVYIDEGGNESLLYWEGESQLLYGSETTSGFNTWLTIDVDRSSGTLTFTKRYRGSAYTLSIYQNPEIITIPRENLPPEVDTTTETWAKKTGFINVKIPNNETSVVISPQYLPSVGSTVDIIWFHPQVGSEVSNAQVVNNNGLPAIYGAGCSVVWTDEYTATVTSELPGSGNTTRVEVVNTSKTPPDRLPIATNDSLGAVKPVSRENNMSQPVGVGIDGRLWTIGYTLPVAEVATLGGVKPVTATAEMTQPVGVDAAGALYTAPGASGGGGAQPDLSQNDTTADDYIKNRTHWKEPKTVNIPETSIEISNVSQPAEAPFILEIQEGGTYEVTWDGNVYQCVAYILEGTPAIGNATILSMAGGNDEPFLIGSNSGKTAVIAEEAGTHTVSISGEFVVWHTLDKRYLPDSINKKMNSTNPVGTGSFSMNRRPNTIIGEKSHAEGYDTIASGLSSHAEGYETTASNNSSHAEGLGTIASGKYQHAQGQFNIEDAENKYAHIVGNGFGNARSNAHTIDWDGVGWFAGDVYVGGTSQDNGDRLIRLSEQMTEDDALELLAELNVVDPITNENGAVFTDENGAIYVL